MNCIELRKDGQPCGGTARPGTDRCLAHQPLTEERRQKLREAGRLGKKHQQQNAQRRKRKECPLRTTEQKLEALERRAIDVENAGSEATKKADSMAKLVKAAQEVQCVAELERENEELRRLVAEVPELARRLKVVK
jgi:hypothetical protein